MHRQNYMSDSETSFKCQITNMIFQAYTKLVVVKKGPLLLKKSSSSINKTSDLIMNIDFQALPYLFNL